MNQSTSAQQHWRSVLVQFVGSKLNAAAFCHHEGIPSLLFLPGASVYYRSVSTCTKKRRKGIQNAGAVLLETGNQFVSFT